MDNSAFMILVFGGIAIAAIYFVTHTEADHLPAPGPPVYTDSQTGNFAKQCSDIAVNAARSQGIPIPKGTPAALCYLPGYVWDGVKWVASEVADIAKDAAGFAVNVAKDTAKIANAIATDAFDPTLGFGGRVQSDIAIKSSVGLQRKTQTDLKNYNSLKMFGNTIAAQAALGTYQTDVLGSAANAEKPITPPVSNKTSAAQATAQANSGTAGKKLGNKNF